MDLLRDLLDKHVVDRHGRDMGRVDSFVLEMRPGAPPCVIAIEIGAGTALFRVCPMIGRIVAAVLESLIPGAGRPLRVPIDRVIEMADEIKIDDEFNQTAAAVEQRLGRCVRRLTPWRQS